MSAVEPSIRDGLFHAALTEADAPTVRTGERLMTALIVCCLLLDILVVLGAFLLAYWVRFVMPDDEASALGLQEYGRIGALVGVTTVVLLAVHGVYGTASHPTLVQSAAHRHLCGLDCPHRGRDNLLCPR